MHTVQQVLGLDDRGNSRDGLYGGLLRWCWHLLRIDSVQNSVLSARVVGCQTSSKFKWRHQEIYVCDL